MDIRENSFLYKLKEKLIPILAVIVVAILVWIAFGNKIPGLIPLLKEGDGQKIADYLAQETGIKGVIAVILLQAIQVASIVMPGMAIQVAAGLIYGWPEGFLMCYFGFVMVVIACMVPAVPNGVIPFIAAKTPITAREYVTAVAMGSWLQILTSCMAGQFIIEGKWMFTGLAIAFQCLVIIIILWQKDWFLNRMDR